MAQVALQGQHKLHWYLADHLYLLLSCLNQHGTSCTCYRTNTGCGDASADHLYLLLIYLNQHGPGCTTGPTRVALATLLLTASAIHHLWNVLVPRYHFESLVLTGLAPEILDEPKLRPMSYQTAWRRAYIVQSERLCRNFIYGTLKTVSFTPTTGLSNLNLKVQYFNTGHTMAQLSGTAEHSITLYDDAKSFSLR